MRASTADDAIQLVPPKEMGLEKAIEFISTDELVEITLLSFGCARKTIRSLITRDIASWPRNG
jgi:GTP-binding protein